MMRVEEGKRATIWRSHGLHLLLLAAVLLGGNALHFVRFGETALFIGIPLTLAAIVAYMRPGKSVRTEYLLRAPAATPVPTGYRDAAPAMVEPVMQSLRALRYQPVLFTLDQDGRPSPASPDATPLRGPKIELRDARCRFSHVGISVQLPDASGLGALRVTDLPTGFYDEMAQYLLVAAGKSVPGLEFAPMADSSGFEATGSIRSRLPPRPAARQWTKPRAAVVSVLALAALALPPLGPRAFADPPVPVAEAPATPAEEARIKALQDQLRARTQRLTEERRRVVEHAEIAVEPEPGAPPCDEKIPDDVSGGQYELHERGSPGALTTTDVSAVFHDSLADEASAAQPDARGRYAGLIRELEWRTGLEPENDVTLHVESRADPVLLSDGSLYHPGRLVGRAFVWSYRRHVVVCVADIDARGAPKVNYLRFQRASTATNDSFARTQLRRDLELSAFRQVRERAVVVGRR